MATIKRDTKDGGVRLNGHVVVGRSPSCTLRLSDAGVSKQHTEIWYDRAWCVRDLNSRNGTFVDGRRLKLGEVARIEAGARIGFGRAENHWSLVDDQAPIALATRVSDGHVERGDRALLALPTASDPVVTVFEGEDGWCVERAGIRDPVETGETVTVADDDWMLDLPVYLPGTAEIDDSRPTRAEIALQFVVTPNEQIVDITLRHDTDRTVLEPRAHHYMLLTLAREAIADAARGLERGATGWMNASTLAHMLRVNERTLNVHVFRVRSQFAAAGIADAAGVIERHGRSGQIRIGVDNVEVRVRDHTEM